MLLISSSEVGQRAPQHQAVVEAAKKAGVRLLAYTSILHADRSRLALAAEHKATEESSAPPASRTCSCATAGTSRTTRRTWGRRWRTARSGSAGEGRIAAATRADYAAAAVAVLTGSGHENKVYELAGDVPFTMAELAAEVSRKAGKTIAYNNLPPEQYQGVLEGAGLPKPYAAVLADSDAGASRGELNDSSGDLRRLIGRPTTPLADAVAVAFKR